MQILVEELLKTWREKGLQGTEEQTLRLINSAIKNRDIELRTGAGVATTRPARELPAERDGVAVEVIELLVELVERKRRRQERVDEVEEVVIAGDEPALDGSSPPVRAIFERSAEQARHEPVPGAGRIEGSVQQLLGENVTLNGGFTISGDLLAPGTPALRLKDIDYALRLARKLGVQCAFGEVALQLYRKLCDSGFASDNESRIIDVLRS